MLARGFVDDIKHSKPDKEVFKKAEQGLLLLPEECLVVEDAASGVEGALRAGMKTAGIGEANKLSNVSYRLESFAVEIEIHQKEPVAV